MLFVWRMAVRRNRKKIVALAGWLVLLVSFYGLLRLNDLTLGDGVVAVSSWLGRVVLAYSSSF